MRMLRAFAIKSNEPATKAFCFPHSPERSLMAATAPRNARRPPKTLVVERKSLSCFFSTFSVSSPNSLSDCLPCLRAVSISAVSARMRAVIGSVSGMFPYLRLYFALHDDINLGQLLHQRRVLLIEFRGKAMECLAHVIEYAARMLGRYSAGIAQRLYDEFFLAVWDWGSPVSAARIRERISAATSEGSVSSTYLSASSPSQSCAL